MKKRTKAEMAKYRRDLRARKKAQEDVTPRAENLVTPVTPLQIAVTPVAPSPVAPALCSGCKEKLTEIARLSEKVRTLEARLDARTPPKDEAEALRQRVIADKVNRINTFGKGHAIGTARI